MELSPLDLRILRHCSEHGVLESERAIAKKLRISPSTLSFKLRKFEAKGIITTYRLRVDFRKLGFPVIAWAFFSIENSKDTVKLMDEILAFPQVHVCCFLSGDFQLALKAYCKNTEELHALVEKIKTHTGLQNAPSKTFVVSSAIKAHSILADQGIAANVSDVDYTILAEKMLDPHISLAKIGKKHKLHKNTLILHWKKLLAQKIVLKKTPIINPDLHALTGINFSSVCFLKAKDGQKNLLEKQLSELPQVHELNSLAADTTSGFDFLAVIREQNMHAFFRLLNSFYSDKEFSKNIQSVEANILLRADSRRHTYLKDLKLAK